MPFVADKPLTSQAGRFVPDAPTVGFVPDIQQETPPPRIGGNYVFSEISNYLYPEGRPGLDDLRNKAIAEFATLKRGGTMDLDGRAITKAGPNAFSSAQVEKAIQDNDLVPKRLAGTFHFSEAINQEFPEFIYGNAKDTWQKTWDNMEVGETMRLGHTSDHKGITITKSGANEFKSAGWEKNWQEDDPKAAFAGEAIKGATSQAGALLTASKIIPYAKRASKALQALPFGKIAGKAGVKTLTKVLPKVLGKTIEVGAPLGGAVVAAGGIRAVQDQIATSGILPESVEKAYVESGEAAVRNPGAARLGAIAPAGLFFTPGVPRNTKGYTLPAVQGGIGGTMEVGRQIAAGEDIDPLLIAESAAIQAALGRETRLGMKLAPNMVVDAPIPRYRGGTPSRIPKAFSDSGIDQIVTDRSVETPIDKLFMEPVRAKQLTAARGEQIQAEIKANQLGRGESIEFATPESARLAEMDVLGQPAVKERARIEGRAARPVTSEPEAPSMTQQAQRAFEANTGEAAPLSTAEKGAALARRVEGKPVEQVRDIIKEEIGLQKDTMTAPEQRAATDMLQSVETQITAAKAVEATAKSAKSETAAKVAVEKAAEQAPKSTEILLEANKGTAMINEAAEIGSSTSPKAVQDQINQKLTKTPVGEQPLEVPQIEAKLGDQPVKIEVKKRSGEVGEIEMTAKKAERRVTKYMKSLSALMKCMKGGV